MQITFTKNFYKDIIALQKSSRERWTHAINLVKELYRSKDDVHQYQAFFSSHNSKPLRGSDGRLKFRATCSDRIVFTYLRDENNGLYDSLCLEEYVSHDDQNRAGRSGSTAGDIIDVSELFSESATERHVEPLKVIDYRENNSYALSDNLLCCVLSEADIEEIEIGREIDWDDFEIYLSRQQSETLAAWRATASTFISGCAGSGKSVLGVYCLSKFQNEISRARSSSPAMSVYFSLSERLVKMAQNRYSKICRNNNYDVGKRYPMFKDILSFCCEETGINISDTVTWEIFYTKFLLDTYRNTSHKEYDNLIYELQVSPIELWKEIRGTIKGYMGADWTRVEWLNRTVYKTETIKYLQELHDGEQLYYENPDKKQEFKIKSPSLDNLKKLYNSRSSASSADGAKDLILEDLGKIYNSYRNVSLPIAMSEERYIALKETECIYNIVQRKAIYKAFKKYQTWLNGNDYYDENDLAVKVINKYHPYYSLSNDGLTTCYPFDCIVVDEVQDLTQVQIYMIRQLLKEESNLVLLGDEHQIINPTLFSIEHLNAQLHFSKSSECYMSMNFRSQKNIINLVNHMSEIRRKHIAKTEENKEQPIESVVDNAHKPYYLSFSEDNRNKMIEAIIESPDTAVIIPDDNCKDELIKKYGANRQIFTVQEVKGSEFKYVFCYNLLGKYRKEWEEILTSGIARQNAKYRYYFNVFYVAITRSKDFLCIMEKDNNIQPELEREITPFLTKINKFNVDLLSINSDAISKTSVDWYDSALKLEEDGHFDEAILQYKKSNETSEKRNTQKAIIRCEAKKFERVHDFKKAWILAVKIRDIDLVEKYAKSIKNASIIKLTEIMSDTKNNGIKDTDIAKLPFLVKKVCANEEESADVIGMIFDEKTVSEMGDIIGNIALTFMGYHD